jgi:hypothetical protein
MSDDVADGGIKVIIEMGSSYVPTPRLAAAVAELRDALTEAHGGDDDVSGFGMSGAEIGSVGFVQKLESSWRPNQQLSLHQSLCNNEVVEGIFKF